MPARVVRGALLLYGFPLAGFLIGAATGHLVAERIVATSALGLDLSALVGGLGLAALTTLISWRYRHDLGNPAVEAVSCDAYAKRP
jgi:positive regulator of sigma E activity